MTVTMRPDPPEAVMLEDSNSALLQISGSITF